MNAKSITLFVELTETVASVKAKIEEKLNIPADQQCLSFGRRPLLDHQSLASQGVKRESNLDLNLRLRGGSAVVHELAQAANTDNDCTAKVFVFIGIFIACLMLMLFGEQWRTPAQCYSGGLRDLSPNWITDYCLSCGGTFLERYYVTPYVLFLISVLFILPNILSFKSILARKLANLAAALAQLLVAFYGVELEIYDLGLFPGARSKELFPTVTSCRIDGLHSFSGSRSINAASCTLPTNRRLHFVYPIVYWLIVGSLVYHTCGLCFFLFTNKLFTKTRKSVPINQELLARLSSAFIEKPSVEWAEVIGMKDVKKLIHRMLNWPRDHPEWFTGNRKPLTKLLLYGAPGNGKSHIAKAIASITGMTFMAINPSDLMSKWFGESEHLVEHLFQLARLNAPCIIFLDELDSYACKRSLHDSPAERRIKTQLMVEVQGVKSEEDGIVLLAATNTPEDLDEAILRRFQKPIHVRMPNTETRFELIKHLVGDTPNNLTDEHYRKLADLTAGFSISDIGNAVQEGLWMPIIELEEANQDDESKQMHSRKVRTIFWLI